MVDVDVGVIDIMPTVLDYLGLDRPPFLQGTSLRPLIEGDLGTERRFFAESTTFFNSYAIIEGGLKYVGNSFPPGHLLRPEFLLANIRSFYKFRGDELYRIDSDPREKQNLLAPEPEIAHRMREELTRHLRYALEAKAIALDAADDFSTATMLSALELAGDHGSVMVEAHVSL